MKFLKIFLPVLFILATTASCTTAQNPPQKGENVWIIVNYVKESAKADYEKWMNDIFFSPILTTKDLLLKQQFAATRWLTPAKQNDDKTWTYVFLMDPVIPNGDYGIESHLVKTYGEQKGKMYAKQFEDFMAAAGQMHVLNR